MTVLAAAWLVVSTVHGRAPDETTYRTRCVLAAQSALDGLEIARLVADGRGEPKVPSTTAMSILQNAGDLIGDGRSTLASVGPPDRTSIALRDEVTPLLIQANAVYGEVMLARARNDRAAWRAALARIGPVAASLRLFVDRHR